MHHQKAMTPITTIARTFLAVSAMYLFSANVVAADTPAQPELRFSTLDVNHDGMIDAKEAGASPDLAKVIPSADANKDGRLSLEEFSVAQSLMRGSRPIANPPSDRDPYNRQQ